MLNFQNRIFGFFPTRDKVNDINKNANDKGTLERYNEVVGQYLDEEIVPLVENLVDRVIAVDTCEAKFIPYLEKGVGTTELGASLYATEAYRRAVLSHIFQWYKIRGTKRLMKILIEMLGLSVVINEHYPITGFDSPITFDDTERVFDMKCNTCTKYSFDVTGPTGTLDPATFLAIMAILEFNTPINAKFKTASYNGDAFVSYTVNITTQPNGNISYSNPYDPTLQITYDMNGNPIITTDFPFYQIIDTDELLFIIGTPLPILGAFSGGFSGGFS